MLQEEYKKEAALDKKLQKAVTLGSNESIK
jgi:hypothetical protein